MICDIIQTAIDIQNHLIIDKIPYSFLTRIENDHDVLMDLDQLNALKCCIDHRSTVPYTEISAVQRAKMNYQHFCDEHIKKIFSQYMDKNDIVYISMNHIIDVIKNHNDRFYDSSYYKHLHMVFKVIKYDENFIYTEPVRIDVRHDFIVHQEHARRVEKCFNLKYHLKNYHRCMHCLPTICGMSVFMKAQEKSITKLSDIPNVFKNALQLVKNDRIDIKVLCDNAEKNYQCYTLNSYFTKIHHICLNRKWDFDAIITYIHKTHYQLLKSFEHHRDAKVNSPSWNTKRNLNSPSWRSQITVK
ncbi:MAG TPA: hypothetical protein VLG50_08280 [Candidatus Saccharimonadales bacterium]|nr:hypothetical protein [Candidatus Saccharimonadales bacterium]